MSSLQSQLSAFKSDVASSASRLSTKRAVGPQQASKPLPGSSGNAERRVTEPGPADKPNGKVVFSQPALTGTGTHLMTQVTLAVDYLREKGTPMTFEDIVRYLSASRISDQDRYTIEHILKTQHSKVEYDPSGGLHAEGSFRFRPTHNVRSAEDLLALLQRQTTAQGILVKELREGWPGAITAINTLEAEHRVLVTRNPKDGQPKRVWPDDPSLHHPVDPEFQRIWTGLKPPTAHEDLRKELLAYDLIPTSQVKVAKAPAEKNSKRKWKARAGGKVTNTHMGDVLKSYEHLRK